jgi:hypothetical protein
MVSAAQSPALVISLDLEQAWGCEPDRIGDRERAAFLGVRDAVPRILELAHEFDVAITWATVGLLFFDDRDEMLEYLPAERPNYRNPSLCAYSRLGGVGANEKVDPLHFGRSLLLRIRHCPRQEIGGHTFSHYYALEDGATMTAFSADLAAATRAAALLDLQLKSLVFPRNQVNEAYLPICRQAGYWSFRGTQHGAAYSGRSRTSDQACHRMSRLANTYLPDISARTPNWPMIQCGLVNLAASHFLRPTRDRRAVADLLQRTKIRKGMASAARTGATFHLWWHPQNFGLDIAANLKLLRGILEDYRCLSDEFGMRSVAMGDLAERSLEAQISSADVR